MRRNVFDIPRWHLIQHRDARGLPLPASNDTPARRLEDELFERLYTGECEPLRDGDCVPALRAWAERIHASCEALPQFGRLAAECRGDAAAAAAAVESLLGELGELPPPEQPAPGRRLAPGRIRSGARSSRLAPRPRAPSRSCATRPTGSPASASRLEHRRSGAPRAMAAVRSRSRPGSGATRACGASRSSPGA